MFLPRVYASPQVEPPLMPHPPCHLSPKATTVSADADVGVGLGTSSLVGRLVVTELGVAFRDASEIESVLVHQ